MAESLAESNQALFLCHVSSRWLTSLYFKVVLKSWEDSCKYFLEYLPLQKKYKYHLPKKERYHRIKKYMTKSTRAYIYVLVTWNNLTLFQGIPLPPIVKIESRIESRWHIKNIFARNCFESVILSVLYIVCQESFW